MASVKCDAAGATSSCSILLLSEPIIAEVENVLRRPQVLEKLRTGPIAARALLVLLRRQTELATA